MSRPKNEADAVGAVFHARGGFDLMHVSKIFERTSMSGSLVSTVPASALRFCAIVKMRSWEINEVVGNVKGFAVALDGALD